MTPDEFKRMCAERIARQQADADRAFNREVDIIAVLLLIAGSLAVYLFR